MANAVVTFTVEDILNRLRTEGMRITETRRWILEVLFATDKPISLQEIQEQAAAKGEKVDYATVFRMMTVLEKLCLVHKVNLQRPCSYFELQDPSKHYDHIICTECGKVVLLDLPCPLAQTEKFIAERYGFGELTHSLEFFGICSDCRNNRKTV